jgi:hypothetical protein
MKPRLDWTNRDACRAWLADLTEGTADVIAVGEDQTSPIAKRRLGRAMAMHLLGEAAHGVEQLLAYATRGLEVDDESGDSGDHGGADP